MFNSHVKIAHRTRISLAYAGGWPISSGTNAMRHFGNWVTLNLSQSVTAKTLQLTKALQTPHRTTVNNKTWQCILLQRATIIGRTRSVRVSNVHPVAKVVS